MCADYYHTTIIAKRWSDYGPLLFKKGCLDVCAGSLDHESMT